MGAFRCMGASHESEQTSHFSCGCWLWAATRKQHAQVPMRWKAARTPHQQNFSWDRSASSIRVYRRAMQWPAVLISLLVLACTPTDAALEVIGSGYGRTGTDSLRSALNTLGYKTYHMKEIMGRSLSLAHARALSACLSLSYTEHVHVCILPLSHPRQTTNSRQT